MSPDLEITCTINGKHVCVQREHNIRYTLNREAQISNGRAGEVAVPSEANQARKYSRQLKGKLIFRVRKVFLEQEQSIQEQAKAVIVMFMEIREK